MPGKDLTLIAGVFLNETSAQQAMSDLQQAGLTDDQILYSVHKGGADILDALLGLGFGQDEAAYYNSEFMAGHTVLTVMNTDRQQEAYDILQRNGAFDAASRIGPSATDYASTDIDVDADQKTRLHEEQMTDTVRREEVRIERTGDVNIHGVDMVDDVQIWTAQ